MRWRRFLLFTALLISDDSPGQRSNGVRFQSSRVIPWENNVWFGAYPYSSSGSAGGCFCAP